MTEATITRIKRLAFFMWRSLPAGTNLDDVTSEALLGALRARSGCEVIAAKRQVIAYLRAWNRGSRQGVWMRPVPFRDRGSEAPQFRAVMDAETRERVKRAVDVLTAKELEVIRAVYWRDELEATAC